MHWGWQDKFLKSCRTHTCPGHSGKEIGAVLCLSLYGQMMPFHSIGSYWKSKVDSIVLCSWGEFSCYIIMDWGSRGKCPTLTLLVKEPCKMCAVYSRTGGSPVGFRRSVLWRLDMGVKPANLCASYMVWVPRQRQLAPTISIWQKLPKWPLAQKPRRGW